MIYVWAAILIVVLLLVYLIVRWWNLPAVVEARAKRVEARQKNRTERLRIRRGREVVDPVDPRSPDVVKPARRRLFRRWRDR